jgi:hypothetical protein
LVTLKEYQRLNRSRDPFPPNLTTQSPHRL